MRKASNSWKSRLSWAARLSLVSLLLLFPLAARAEQVSLPLTLDHRLLTSLVIKDTFTGKNQSAAIVGGPGECIYIGLSEPRFTTAGSFLQLEMRLSIRLGTELGAECLVPLEWQGYVTLVQQPVFDNQSLALAFRTVDSKLYNLNRQPVSVASVLWDFAKPRVIEHFGRVRINLAPPIREMRDFLAPLFHDREAMQAMLDSLRGGATRVEKDGVVVELTAEVEEVFSPEEKPESAELTPEEHRWLIRLWETWDALLVQLITTIAIDSPLRPEDQELLIDVLLDTRYAFVATLEDEDLDRDFVREQFVQAWHDLGPIFRRQLFARLDTNSLGYLAFFTAADALAVFDRMGPTFGVEISEQGLLRLATMLTGGETTLPYTLDVDDRLRKLLQLPMLKNDGSAPAVENELEEIDLPIEEKKEEEDPFSRLSDILFSPAYAADSPPRDDILEWRVPQKNIAGYVERVRKVLDEVSLSIVARQQLPDQLHGMYQKMVMATAWQESCFRQFTEKGNKLTYLLSYNNSSVGVMQVNERVWRGIYDIRKLRWDIRYNAMAGAEIVDLYLRRHALSDKASARLDPAQLAKGVYAMYNGGPGQYKKYLERAKTGKTYLSDRSFAEKLEWVEKRDWEKISECLGSG